MAKENTDTTAENENSEVEEVDEDTELDETETDTEDADETEAESNDEDDEVVSVKDLDKVKKALESERVISKDRAKEVRSLKRQLADAKKSKPEEVDAQKAVADAESRASRFRDIAVRKEAERALQEAGSKVSTKRLLKLLDLDGVEIDDAGKVEGLEDAIDELMDESPEFFKSADEAEEKEETKRPRVKRPGNIDGGTKTTAQRKLTTAELLLKQAGLRS